MRSNRRSTRRINFDYVFRKLSESENRKETRRITQALAVQVDVPSQVTSRSVSSTVGLDRARLARATSRTHDLYAPRSDWRFVTSPAESFDLRTLAASG